MDKSPSVKFANFNGMDNVHQDYELGHDTLRRAINVDVLDSGRLRRRKGSAQVLATTNTHSLWGDGMQALFVLSNQLLQFMANGTTALLGAFAAGTNWTSYYKINGFVYATCKTARARIANGVLTPWGVEVPSAAPTLTASVGVMPAAKYLACVTYLLADGRESGSSKMASITLATAGGIATLSMPIPVDTSVTKKRLYLSTADGEVLFMAAEAAPADQFAAIGSPPAGAQLRTQFKMPPPFGAGITHSNGRLYIIDAADPRIVWFTDAQDYDHVDIRKNYYQYGEPVTVVAGVNDGVYMCAGKTYFVQNAGTPEASQTERLDFGAIANSYQEIPNSDSVIWMSSRGPVIGKLGGQVELIAEKSMAAGEMNNSASMLREKDGVRQLVVVGSKTQDSGLQAGSYADAEIVRRAAL